LHSKGGRKAVRNDDISSYIIYGNCHVQMYEHSDFGGTEMDFKGVRGYNRPYGKSGRVIYWTRYDTCLVGNGFNDKLSSMRVSSLDFKVPVKTSYPTSYPTTGYPTSYPTAYPTTGYPTSYPTAYPTTGYPTSYPTAYPTSNPTGILAHQICPTVHCKYVNHKTIVFIGGLDDENEKWHCEKFNGYTNNCKCVCNSSLKCALRHHHYSGYKKTFEHC
jgi:hypothetical protein